MGYSAESLAAGSVLRTKAAKQRVNWWESRSPLTVTKLTEAARGRMAARLERKRASGVSGSLRQKSCPAAGGGDGGGGAGGPAAEVLHGGERGRWSEGGKGQGWAGEGCEEGGIVEGIEMDVGEEEGGDGLRGRRGLGAKGTGGEVAQCEDGERGRAARQATRLQRRNAGILPLRAAQGQNDSPSSQGDSHGFRRDS